MALTLVTLLERPSLLQGYKLVLPLLLPLHLWSKSGNWIEASVSSSGHRTTLLVNYRQAAAATLYLFWLGRGWVLFYVTPGTQPQRLTEPPLRSTSPAIRSCLVSGPAREMSECQLSPMPSLWFMRPLRIEHWFVILVNPRPLCLNILGNLKLILSN